MARITRIVLDMTLVSLRKIGPAVSTLWFSAKTAIVKTPAKPLVCNEYVTKAESTLDRMTDVMIAFITNLRDRQLPKELEYLERELEKVKKASKTLKPVLATAWQYAKVEVVPPMTIAFFHGRVGKKIEDAASKVANSFIANVQKQIRDIDLEEAREIKRKAAEAKDAEARIKAEAKRKAEDARKKEEEKVAKEAKVRQQADAEKKAKADQKAAADAAKIPKTKADAKKKAKRKAPKKNRRKVKKGSPPKSKM